MTVTVNPPTHADVLADLAEFEKQFGTTHYRSALAQAFGLRDPAHLHDLPASQAEPLRRALLMAQRLHKECAPADADWIAAAAWGEAFDGFLKREELEGFLQRKDAERSDFERGWPPLSLKAIRPRPRPSVMLAGRNGDRDATQEPEDAITFLLSNGEAKQRLPKQAHHTVCIGGPRSAFKAGGVEEIGLFSVEVEMMDDEAQGVFVSITIGDDPESRAEMSEALRAAADRIDRLSAFRARQNGRRRDLGY